MSRLQDKARNVFSAASRVAARFIFGASSVPAKAILATSTWKWSHFMFFQ